MGIFLTTLLSLTFVFLAFGQLTKNKYGLQPHEENAIWSPVVLLVSSVCLLISLWGNDRPDRHLPLFISVTLSAIYPLSCSVIPPVWHKCIALTSSASCVIAALTMLCFKPVFHQTFPEGLSVICAVMFCCIPSLMFLAGIYRRIRDMKVILRAGSVWSVLCLGVDAVYGIVLLLYAILLNFVPPWLSAILLASVLVALCLRIRNHSVFVLMTDHERKIVESMRLSNIEYTCENHGSDVLYDNIYERLLRYFETRRPFLDNNLTINDVVDVMYTNKLYISRAISHCTGRNFCQFVNYHRVSYAVEIFRTDPQLKIVELSDRCGFNSTTSFTNAFKLYMGEKPGDWCRKERARLSKK